MRHTRLAYGCEFARAIARTQAVLTAFSSSSGHHRAGDMETSGWTLREGERAQGGEGLSGKGKAGTVALGHLYPQQIV